MSEPSRGLALSRLMVAIHQADEAGAAIPCLNVRRSHLWLSEDRADQDAAALGCSSCPALAACSRYITEHPEPSGVWAGTFHRYQRKATA